MPINIIFSKLICPIESFIGVFLNSKSLHSTLSQGASFRPTSVSSWVMLPPWLQRLVRWNAHRSVYYNENFHCSVRHPSKAQRVRGDRSLHEKLGHHRRVWLLPVGQGCRRGRGDLQAARYSISCGKILSLISLRNYSTGKMWICNRVFTSSHFQTPQSQPVVLKSLSRTNVHFTPFSFPTRLRISLLISVSLIFSYQLLSLSFSFIIKYLVPRFLCPLSFWFSFSPISLLLIHIVTLV